MSDHVITTSERAELFGLSYRDQRAIELAEPWLKSWAARHGHGLAHARAWLAAGRPVADRSAVDVEGEPAIAAIVRDVLAILPAAVVWRLVTGRVQIRCGRVFADRSYPASVRGRCDVTRDPLLVLVFEASEETVAHELGHAWNLVPNSAWLGLDAEQRERLHAYLRTDVDEQSVAAHVDSTMVTEFAADRLASLWLGRTVDSTSGAYGETRRRRIRAEFHGGQVR